MEESISYSTVGIIKVSDFGPKLLPKSQFDIYFLTV